MRGWVVAVVVAGAIGCAARAPRALVGDAANGLDAFLAAHARRADEPIHADRIARTDGASYHVVQIARGEPPHRHRQHDLTVVVLRGRGTSHVGDATTAVAPGDTIAIPRGTVHWFTNDGSSDAVTLAVFSPPLDAPDSEPATAFDPHAPGR